jgi:hypothetical protein
MFVKRDYRDRAIGLIAAFVVLGVGIKVTGAMATPRSEEPRVREYVNEMQASACTLARRSEETVPVC